MADIVNLTIRKLYLYVHNITPIVETQLTFFEATRENYKLSLDDFFKKRRLLSDLIVHIDIGSTQSCYSSSLRALSIDLGNQ